MNWSSWYPGKHRAPESWDDIRRDINTLAANNNTVPDGNGRHRYDPGFDLTHMIRTVLGNGQRRVQYRSEP